jgi:branched-chain amino acid aminotransferase
MSFDQSKWVWRNGEIIPWSEATTHVSTHALHYGSAVFEGMRCYETDDGPAVFRMNEHLERLNRSAAVHSMQIPYDSQELADSICELIDLHDFRSCYIRPICYYGSGSLSLHPGNCPVEVSILVWPWAAYLGAEGLKHGVRITVSPWKKFHSEMMPTTAKASGQYINSILAVREAVSRGYDEALLLNMDGSVAEGSGENLFVVRKGELFTNDERHSILLGVTRDAVIRLAEDLGFHINVGPISVEMLMTADEAFFTGTAAEVTPIREVDGTVIKDGKRGPVTELIQKVFFEATSGRDDRHRNWLTYVSRKLVGVD